MNVKMKRNLQCRFNKNKKKTAIPIVFQSWSGVMTIDDDVSVDYFMENKKKSRQVKKKLITLGVIYLPTEKIKF